MPAITDTLQIVAALDQCPEDWEFLIAVKIEDKPQSDIAYRSFTLSAISANETSEEIFLD